VKANHTVHPSSRENFSVPSLLEPGGGKAAMSLWKVYLIRTRSGALYAGTTTDVARRLAEHGRGGSRGSKYLRSRGPLTLVYQAEVGGRALACRAESRIKRLTRLKKEEIVSTAFTSGQLLSFLGLAPHS